MKYNNEWKDYTVIKTGNGEKLEKWGNVLLLRPDPQVIWKTSEDLSSYKGLNAHYHRIGGGGGFRRPFLPLFHQNIASILTFHAVTDTFRRFPFLPAHLYPEIPLFAAFFRYRVVLQQHIHVPTEALGPI